jgi:drug/metabolite transporter (DMT)-like permease
MSSIVAPVEDRRSLGIGLLVFAQLFFAGLDTSAKWLAVSGIPTGEIVFMRYAVHVALIVVLIMPVRGRALFRTGNWKLEVLRGFCLLAVTVTNFLAMQFLPLTVTGALLFTMPLMVCALSVPMLGERVGWRRWLAIIVGFIGVVIIVRPGTEAFHPAALLCLAGAASAAIYAILTRKLAGVDTAATQQFYAGLVALICVTPFAFSGWVWPSNSATWFALFAVGLFGVLAHGINTVALRFAPPSVLAPFSYLELVYLAFASWIIFAEPPDIWFYLGAPIIILSGLYIWLRERALRRPTAALAAED